MPNQSSELIARTPLGVGSSSLRLLGCFGFPVKVEEKPPVTSGRRETFRRRFPWTKKSAAKTAPVELESGTVSDSKTDRDSGIHGTATSDQSETSQLKETQGTTAKHATCQKQTSYGRRGVAGGGNLGLPEAKQKSRQGHQSVVFDPTRNIAHAHKQSASQAPIPNEMVNEVQATEKEKYDPIIGIAIVVVTLLIMLIWGKLCAVFCTCAWCYFIPRHLRAAEPAKKSGTVAGKPSDANLSDPDLRTDEYKKRVVLEGLLERNHRTPPVYGVL